MEKRKWLFLFFKKWVFLPVTSSESRGQKKSSERDKIQRPASHDFHYSRLMPLSCFIISYCYYALTCLTCKLNMIETLRMEKQTQRMWGAVLWFWVPTRGFGARCPRGGGDDCIIPAFAVANRILNFYFGALTDAAQPVGQDLHRALQTCSFSLRSPWPSAGTPQSPCTAPTSLLTLESKSAGFSPDPLPHSAVSSASVCSRLSSLSCLTTGSVS